MKKMLLIICTLFLFMGHIFSQPLDRPGSLIHGVCWAKRNVDKPGTFAETFEEYGMLYQWEASRGWIATNFFTGGDTIISTKDPCPVGWRIPTVEETKSLYVGDGVGGGKSIIVDPYIYFSSSSTNSLVYLPIYEWLSSKNPVVTPKSSYWSGSEDTNDPSKAWAFFFVDGSYYNAFQQVVPRDYPLLIRCVADTECDSIVTHDTVTICSTDLPYEWNDTTFLEGTKTGTYCLRFRPNSCGCMNIAYLHLTVQEENENPCPGVLINGVCWAEYNVDEPGRFANPGKPYGMLYQWNRKKGWPAMTPKSVSGWDSSLEPGDTWEPANDPCPMGWRMPTAEEMKSLTDETKVTYTEQAGQDGAFGSRYTDISTGNTLFLPIAGYRNAQGVVNNVLWVHYWSGTDYWMLERNGTWQYPYAWGFPVRCVADENACDIVLTVSENICKEALPYTWHDTTFREGTVTGEYRIQRTNPISKCDTIFYLYLTVDTLCGKPCKERGVFINGVCWAESNVDSPNTFADTPEAFGLLYQWNRKKGLPLQGDIDPDDWMSYDSYVRWEAVNNPCPADWRIPTIGEIYTLLDELRVTREWVQQNGVYGMRFTDKINGNTVFLPPAGFRGDPIGSYQDDNFGWYRSSTVYEESSVWGLLFGNETFVYTSYFNPGAFSVRCVVGRDMPDCGSTVTDTSVTVCTKDLPYEWGDTIFDIGTGSGTYSFRYVSAVTGCDSIVNLNLTVHQPFDTTFYDTVCRGASYNLHGFSLSNVQTDDTYTLPLSSRAGCDSTLILHLKVNPVYDTILYDTVCQGDAYYKYGLNLAAVTGSLTHTQSLHTIHGCDSTVTLNLHVWPKYFNSQTKDICSGDTVDFRGRKLYKSGVYYDSLKTVYGCDSVFSMTLNVHPVYGFSFSGAVCSGSPYSNYGFSLPAVYRDTIVRDTFKTRWGCDSLRTLYLTVRPVYDTILYDTICRGKGYYLHGFSLPEGTLGGTFTQNHLSVHGCDSTVTLNLHVWPTYFNSQTKDICDGDTIDFRGRKLYKSGVYYDSLKTVHGCDSVYRMTLTVHSTVPSYIPDAVCSGSGYHKYGFHLSAVYRDTVFRDTFQSVWGCDSIRILSLSVRPVYDTPLYDTVCQGDDYRSHGFSLSNVQKDGVYTLPLSSRWGCDSVLTLHLKVHPVYNTILYDSVCPSARYVRHGFHLSDVRETGTYRLPLHSVYGCDSLVTLELYVYPTYFYPRTENICEGDTFDFRGRRLYESGTYYDSLTTVHGCDSVYCLYLTVHPVYDVRLSGILCEGTTYNQYGFSVTTPGEHYLYLKTIARCDSTVLLTLTEEKKVEGTIGLSLEDCSLHGYAFFFNPVVPQSVWLWEMGDGTVFRSEEGYHTYADSGLYRIQLRLETSGGCENLYSYVQYVPPYFPEIPIRANRLLIDEDYPTVHFRVDVLPGMRCEWDFGDGATGVGDSVSHTYDAHSEKYYDVWLKVFNADSCVTESRAQIEVAFFPKALNTFSPNGDGINDVFMGDYRIEIINRNGLRIYTGENGWDGTYKGSPAPADTYFYRLYYRTALGERMKTGYVTLIR